MKILVNGHACDLAAQTLQAALVELDYGGSTVATALNGDVVVANQRATTALAEGDRLEILVPMQGG